MFHVNLVGNQWQMFASSENIFVRWTVIGSAGIWIWNLGIIKIWWSILGVLERKILRAIFGPTNDNGEWRIKYNDELYTVYKENDIVTYIKIDWDGQDM
jgi:hypothetical protein